MITDLQLTRDKIKNLFSLSETQYENIFSVAKCDKYFFYNIIKKVSFPDELGNDIYMEKYITAEQPWTTFSHRIYGTQDLWWLICCVNKIKNPTINPEPGKVYKIIRPDLVSGILAEINRQIK
tara:strand:- start:57 stop:425 length:369 start_codon:yes stop_codon:yes gene_type:complete